MRRLTEHGVSPVHAVLIANTTTEASRYRQVRVEFPYRQRLTVVAIGPTIVKICGESRLGHSDSPRPVPADRAFVEQLTTTRFCALSSAATVSNRARNTQILSFRDESNDVFFILEGRLQVKNYSEHGREFIFSEIGAGQIFGEFSAIDGLPRSASVVAMEDSVVARMKAADFVALLRSDFDLTLRLLRILTGKARGLSDRIFELIALNARDRICFELARLAVTGVHDGPRVMIRPAPTHYEIAARIGSHREAVTRELNHLVARGYVEFGRRHVVIVDLGRFTHDLLPARPA